MLGESVPDHLRVAGHRIPHEGPHRPGDEQEQERRYANTPALQKQTAKGQDHHDRPDGEPAGEDGEQVAQQQDERGRPLPGALSRRLLCSDRRHVRGPQVRTGSINWTLRKVGERRGRRS